MLEHYFVLPKTIDRIRASWIADPIERYVAWLHHRGHSESTIRSRVPILVKFGEFAAAHGARSWEKLPEHLVAFVEFWPRRRGQPVCKRGEPWHVQKPIEEMLQCALPGFERLSQRPRSPVPFATEVPGFFPYLRTERGLCEATVRHYLHYLRRFQQYLVDARCPDLRELSPKLLCDFVQRTSSSLSVSSVAAMCGALREFLRYLHRDKILVRDLRPAVELPHRYRLDRVPRSIPWAETQRLLEQIDRRGKLGQRDFAIVLLLVTYGLRAHEVAALTLEDVNWRSGILRISERKGGHSTQYRLTAAAGDALVVYIEKARPQVQDRRIFFNMHAPLQPLRPHAISHRVTYWLRQAGISVPRAGSHTLRHAVVQHLLDNNFSLREIGEYVGHRSPNSTQIYAKVDLHHLREISLGYGEEALR